MMTDFAINTSPGITFDAVGGGSAVFAPTDYYVEYDSGAIKPIVMRPDAEKVYTVSYDKYIKHDEGITIPAYSATATTLKASETLSPTVPIRTADYNYLILIRCLSIPEYSVTTKSKGRVEYSFASSISPVRL